MALKNKYKKGKKKVKKMFVIIEKGCMFAAAKKGSSLRSEVQLNYQI
jgi:hypothetical protein